MGQTYAGATPGTSALPARNGEKLWSENDSPECSNFATPWRRTLVLTQGVTTHSF